MSGILSESDESVQNDKLDIVVTLLDDEVDVARCSSLWRKEMEKQEEKIWLQVSLSHDTNELRERVTQLSELQYSQMSDTLHFTFTAVGALDSVMRVPAAS